MIRKIAAAQFKAQCLQLIEYVKNKHTPLLITKRGVAIAKLVLGVNLSVLFVIANASEAIQYSVLFEVRTSLLRSRSQ